MRRYSTGSIEALRALKLLKRWTAQGLLTQQQHEHLQEETVSDLRTTNFFLRAVLFLFTLIVLAAVTGLLFITMFEHSSAKDLVIPFLLLAAACYAAAEYVAAEAKLYHFGIEEALVVYSIGSLFAGLQAGHQHFTAGADPAELFILLACVIYSLWTSYRFGYWYTFVAAMLFAAFLPHCCTSTPAMQHMLVATFYAFGLVGIAMLGARDRFDSSQSFYSVAEMLLWSGIYLAVNLVLSRVDLSVPRSITELVPVQSDFSRPFYWFTWILIWCLPAVVLARAIRRKDRIVLALGACLTILTLISNKPYLGWQRRPWDPMILGILLISFAWFVQRWLARSPAGIRAGFTAARLAGQDTSWMDAGTSAMGFVTPHPINPQPSNPAVPLGQGGSSGGGGASRDF